MEDGVPEETNFQEKVQGSPAGCRAFFDGTVDLHTDKYEGKSWNWNNKAFKKIEYYNCRKVRPPVSACSLLFTLAPHRSRPLTTTTTAISRTSRSPEPANSRCDQSISEGLYHDAS